MENQELVRKFLIDSFTEDGWFYIVNQTSLLVTDDSEIKIGAQIQFAFPDKGEHSKIRKGKIIMESRKYISSFVKKKIF